MAKTSVGVLWNSSAKYTIQFVALTNKQDILVLFSASCFHHASSKNLLKLVVIVSQGMGHTNPREDSHPLPI